MQLTLCWEIIIVYHQDSIIMGYTAPSVSSNSEVQSLWSSSSDLSSSQVILVLYILCHVILHHVLTSPLNVLYHKELLCRTSKPNISLSPKACHGWSSTITPLSESMPCNGWMAWNSHQGPRCMLSQGVVTGVMSGPCMYRCWANQTGQHDCKVGLQALLNNLR